MTNKSVIEYQYERYLSKIKLLEYIEIYIKSRMNISDFEMVENYLLYYFEDILNDYFSSDETTENGVLLSIKDFLMHVDITLLIDYSRTYQQEYEHIKAIIQDGTEVI